MDIVSQMRRLIDAKHAEALRALETLQKYLDESSPRASDAEPQMGESQRSAASSDEVNGEPPLLRDRVMNVLRERDATVKEIADIAAITERQVRGVVNAPGLKFRKIFRREEGGRTIYTLRDPSESA